MSFGIRILSDGLERTLYRHTYLWHCRNCDAISTLYSGVGAHSRCSDDARRHARVLGHEVTHSKAVATYKNPEKHA